MRNDQRNLAASIRARHVDGQDGLVHHSLLCRPACHLQRRKVIMLDANSSRIHPIFRFLSVVHKRDILTFVHCVMFLTIYLVKAYDFYYPLHQTYTNTQIPTTMDRMTTDPTTIDPREWIQPQWIQQQRQWIKL